MSKSTQKKIGAFAAAAAIGVVVVAPTSAQAGSKPLSPEQTIEQIKRFGNKWAPAFAAGSEKNLSQPAGQSIDCKGPGGGTIGNCTPMSSAYLKSFQDARVQDIAIKGGHAAARFSNGEAIDLGFKVRGTNAGPGFFATIYTIGGKAGNKLFKCCSTN
jgi:hypothetical protein